MYLSRTFLYTTAALLALASVWSNSAVQARPMNYGKPNDMTLSSVKVAPIDIPTRPTPRTSYQDDMAYSLQTFNEGLKDYMGHSRPKPYPRWRIVESPVVSQSFSDDDIFGFEDDKRADSETA
ncbi:hypothetical protein H4R33_000085 [Dimargaris cristalligena]|uniref:Uncharacterized protein n=1 Tax=Dimargaris cristalligena TaxID=215637 RepID=A0A4P9ZTL3_9FUNG|nr:hypothetical protein H4R33_000085 [Dimargaris cristalligena]RKP36092.1 hypothetical protein BJ085DRAFT_30715 [Dimargaris cristalligena]|eukprot:RKP36092.1 hypothetical protein BJ085DRAFT_30715 [Dimargaris cristalligena]